MQITLELPQTLYEDSNPGGGTCREQRLKAWRSKLTRSHALTAAQLRRLLGFQTGMQVDAFLKEHEVYDFTASSG